MIAVLQIVVSNVPKCPLLKQFETGTFEVDPRGGNDAAAVGGESGQGSGEPCKDSNVKERPSDWANV